MKLFNETFKLYAYKNHDRCDLSIKSSDNLVYTFRLTHDEIKKLLTEYGFFDRDSNEHGVRFKSQNGPFWFAMIKKNFNCIRLTIGVQGGLDLNFRISYSDWDTLKFEYENQMSNPMAWDNK